ncbi:Hsp20/alpha crystallin family protein [Pandoraea apista]|uniref:Heat-shock protein Hsp20 n=1 Tax=Pandoraea apista TaxID=93218 RepID=A0A5E5P7C5_9BURK|nr:Hsp20/alpha crystallin family protein [Pandoraea apista]AJE97283.1 heat-shock protein Hsp20 [Pandoraea apista]AKH71248.1 heat-shock protein Hsp20 [Pandoraea apista]AKI63520.1 heat-shock protein Hsp20 [Pandoraea apista]AVF41890.1 Hsp20/alpha crystallin family protein [Pandoraea apista]OXS97655.1 heat-shock protein Hsp20 [Pandoraea apista]
MNENTELTSRSSRTDVVGAQGGETAKPLTRIAPAVDVFEDSRGITLYADLPGVPREKLEVRVQDGSLNIEAEAIVPTPAELRLLHGEVRHPHFRRAFTLSPDFDVTRIDAQLRDGVLKLTIPRREEAKPRRIQVSVEQT